MPRSLDAHGRTGGRGQHHRLRPNGTVGHNTDIAGFVAGLRAGWGKGPAGPTASSWERGAPPGRSSPVFARRSAPDLGVQPHPSPRPTNCVPPPRRGGVVRAAAVTIEELVQSVAGGRSHRQRDLGGAGRDGQALPASCRYVDTTACRDGPGLRSGADGAVCGRRDARGPSPSTASRCSCSRPRERTNCGPEGMAPLDLMRREVSPG